MHTNEPWTNPPKIPGSVRFPGGYVIPVEVRARGTVCCPGGLEFEFEPDMDSVYASDCGIFLWEGLTPKQRWHRLTHETIHALVDWQRWVEIKTRRS